MRLANIKQNIVFITKIKENVKTIFGKTRILYENSLKHHIFLCYITIHFPPIL